MLDIRYEKEVDEEAVRLLNELAFGGPAEGRIVDCIRRSCEENISLVAEEDGEIVGHILFSPVFIESDGGRIGGMGLGPMAVLPERQGRGIGSMLVRAGLELLIERNCPFAVVLGHPEFYPRFGFEPASRYGTYAPWDGVPDEAFMLLIFDERAMTGVSGVARYRHEFDDAM